MTLSFVTILHCLIPSLPTLSYMDSTVWPSLVNSLCPLSLHNYSWKNNLVKPSFMLTLRLCPRSLILLEKITLNHFKFMTLDLIWARNPSRHSYYSSPINVFFHPQKQKLYFFSSFLKPPKAPHLLISTRTSIPTSQRKTLIRCEWLCLPPVGLPCCLYLYLTVIMKNLGPLLSKPCILPCIPSPLNSRICILLLSPFCPALTLSPFQLGHLTYIYTYLSISLLR